MMGVRALSAVVLIGLMGSLWNIGVEFWVTLWTGKSTVLERCTHDWGTIEGSFVLIAVAVCICFMVANRVPDYSRRISQQGNQPGEGNSLSFDNQTIPRKSEPQGVGISEVTRNTPQNRWITGVDDRKEHQGVTFFHVTFLEEGPGPTLPEWMRKDELWNLGDLTRHMMSDYEEAEGCKGEEGQRIRTRCEPNLPLWSHFALAGKTPEMVVPPDLDPWVVEKEWMERGEKGMISIIPSADFIVSTQEANSTSG